MPDPTLPDWVREICADALVGLEDELEASGADFPQLTLIARNPGVSRECFFVITNEPNAVAEHLKAAIREAPDAD